MNAFHSTNLFCCFSRYQAPANSVAPPSVYEPHTTHNSSIRSDEGLTLETSAFESLYGGQLTLSTQLIKPNYLVILPPTQHHSFFRNLPLYWSIMDLLYSFRGNFSCGIRRVVPSGQDSSILPIRCPFSSPINASCPLTELAI